MAVTAMVVVVPVGLFAAGWSTDDGPASPDAAVAEPDRVRESAPQTTGAAASSGRDQWDPTAPSDELDVAIDADEPTAATTDASEASALPDDRGTASSDGGRSAPGSRATPGTVTTPSTTEPSAAPSSTTTEPPPSTTPAPPPATEEPTGLIEGVLAILDGLL
ncbi:MAG: hypothetical protein ACRD2C_12900 [Acidimicrobiales bacterium]